METVVKLIALIDLIEPLELVGLIDLIKSINLIDPVGLKICFSIFKLKFLMKLSSIGVCILALDGSSCCMSLIVSSNEH